VDFGKLSMCLTGEEDTDEFETTTPPLPLADVVLLDDAMVEEQADEEVGFQGTLSTFSLNSYRMQMDPFSPIR